MLASRSRLIGAGAVIAAPTGESETVREFGGTQNTAFPLRGPARDAGTGTCKETCWIDPTREANGGQCCRAVLIRAFY